MSVYHSEGWLSPRAHLNAIDSQLKGWLIGGERNA